MIKKSLEQLLQQLRTPEPYPAFWDILWLPVMLGIIYLITFFMSVFLLATLLDSSFDAPKPDVLVGGSLLSGLLTLGFTFQYVGVAVSKGREEKRIKGDLRVWDWLRLDAPPETPLWGAALVGFALAVLVDTIGLVLGVPASTLPLPLAGLDESNTVLFGAAVFTLLIIRPIAAQLILQGVWYPALVKTLPPLYAVGVSSLLFAIASYLIDPEYLWWGFVTPLAIGWTAGIARAATKSTQTAIVMHMMFSLFIILRAILN